MKKRYLIFFVLAFAALTLMLSGCGDESTSLEGKNVVTFELGGGTLETATSSVNTNVKFAYYPDTYILDPSELAGYMIYRQGYNFTGWYTTADCNPGDKWDFENTLFSQETLTLYAGWEKALLHTYTVCYVKDGSTIELGKYQVDAGDKFNDRRDFASLRDGYTPVGYYQDAELTEKWDDTFAHPGGESDVDITVYVDYIEGKWTMVNTLSKLRSAINAGENVYLTADIDGEGDSWKITGTYKGIFEGNGFTVKNFKVEQTGTMKNPTCTIFSELGGGAEIRNVSFTDVTYNLEYNEAAANTIQITVNVAALAKSSSGNVKISKVSVTGKLVTNYTGELPQLLKPVFAETGTVEATDFTANITVEKAQ